MAHNRAVVITPLYKRHLTQHEIFSLQRTIDILYAYEFFIIAPLHLQPFMPELKTVLHRDFHTRFFPDYYFSSIQGYNNLLMSKSLYESFINYEFMLIVQTDALVLSDRLAYWCDKNFSYVGAPWFIGFNKPKIPLTFFGVGNGGFSLRKIPDALKVLQKPRHIPNTIKYTSDPLKTILGFIKDKAIRAYNFRPLLPTVNEDFFWGVLVKNSCDFFTVPLPQEASRFSFEVAPDFLYSLNNGELPFGCHAWEKYNPEFWNRILKECRIN